MGLVLFPKGIATEAAAPRTWNGVALTPPAIREVANLARLGGVEKLESVVEHGELLWDVEGLSQWMPKRPAQEQCARWLHFFSDIAQDRNGHGRNSSCFDGPLNQSDGPIAQPSSRREKHEVRLFRGQAG